ncbi:MAG TPA: sulfatase [Vicinamibacteria bacterium]|nr:sulfatase [Vicinamibacteria bacterium]
MRRRLRLAAGILAVTWGSACGGRSGPTPAPKAPQPNFVIIIADDMAYGLVGPGRRVPFLTLPNLEGLAARSVQFDRAFVTTSLCSPSRATMLSGLYAHTHGVFVNETVDLSPDIPTYPQILRGAGYHTAFVGKWHMNAASDMPRPGFDYWLSFRGQGVYNDPVLDENGRTVSRTGYITDLLTEYAVDWLQRTTPPFLLILSHKAPHAPCVPAPRHAAAFADGDFPEPQNYEDTFAGKPAWQRRYVRCGGTPSAMAQCPDPQPSEIPPWPWAAHESHRVDYARTLLALDDSVGSVLSTLQAQGVASSTYVVFLSDNGLFLGEHRLGDKRLAYEESLRVPFLVGGGSVAGARSNVVALNLDLAPTILDLAGLPVPASMQGRSLAPVLHGGTPASRDTFLYEYQAESTYPVVPSMLALRTPRWKYVTYPDGGDEELYDLENDSGELSDLASSTDWDATRADLRRELDQLLRATGAAP